MKRRLFFSTLAASVPVAAVAAMEKPKEETHLVWNGNPAELGKEAREKFAAEIEHMRLAVHKPKQVTHKVVLHNYSIGCVECGYRLCIENGAEDGNGYVRCWNPECSLNGKVFLAPVVKWATTEASPETVAKLDAYFEEWKRIRREAEAERDRKVKELEQYNKPERTTIKIKRPQRYKLAALQDRLDRELL